MTEVYANLEELSHAAAELFIQTACDAVGARGSFAIVLSGGMSPRRTYQLLATPRYRPRVPWDKVHVFWGDERCVPRDDSRSNAGMAFEALLFQVPVPPEHIHPIRCDIPPGEAAEEYEEVIRGFFEKKSPRFDLIFLGLGENGHTASLFPGDPALSDKKWVREVLQPGEGINRITLTPRLINQAASVVFLVSGKNKAFVLREVLDGPSQPQRLPAQFIRPSKGELLWLVDKTAATEIKAPLEDMQ